MGTTLLGQKALSASIEQTITGNYKQNGTYTRVYIVEADDECNDEYSVLFGTDGLPGINDQSTIYPALRVSSRSATEVAPRFWEVTIVWTLPEPPEIGNGGGGSGSKKTGTNRGLGPGIPERDQTGSGASPSPDRKPQELPPWERPDRVTFTSSKKKVAMTHGYYFGTSENGLPISEEPTYHFWTKNRDKLKVDESGFFQIPFTNSAGEPFSYDTDRIVWEATYEASLRDINFEAISDRVGTVNGLPCNIGGVVFRKYTVLFTDLSLSEEFWTDPETGENIEYWNMRCTYEIDYHTHCVCAADVGARYFLSIDFDDGEGFARMRDQGHVYGKDGYPFVNKAEEFVTGFLNGRGGEDIDGETNFLFYCPYRISFNWT